METSTKPNEPRRALDLWFEDGNLVIQAGTSQFRVYRGILAARSSIFQDMLAFPQPPDSEVVEECPLVCLPDAESEVSDFLKAIFIPEYFPAFPALTTSDVIVGCLRLSHKYEVDYLRRRALIHLSSRYRTTLAEFDSRVCSSPDSAPSKAMSWPWPDVPTFTLCVIQLAREVDALWVLPLAFYDLSTGCNMPKDSPKPRIGREIFHGAVHNGLPTSLSAQDQDSFLQGHTIHTRAAAGDIMRFLSHPQDIEGCTSPVRCLAVRLEALEKHRADVAALSHIPLRVWGPDNWKKLEDVCPACLAGLKSTHAKAREAFWDDLPNMYGLPSWKELRQMWVAAIGNSLLCSRHLA
ncbi:hypothetical protein B0H17DRAFT_961266 [Mycena rosella]|uniref:BTB domain-containing protein n=1 Tax=Mycena rosella TaxID=1033263 RepID=A0AAD7C2Q3_MYCRO|nr:hypothetical protein B0H17DRAFT_961266 [Mycena rosella]